MERQLASDSDCNINEHHNWDILIKKAMQLRQVERGTNQIR